MAAGAVAASPGRAAWVYSGQVNIPIPYNIDGVYLNFVTGVTGSSAASVPGWDFNPYVLSGTTYFFANGTSGVVAGTPAGPASVLAFGAIVGPASVFNTGTASGSNFSSNSEGLIGFRFLNEQTGQINYGWADILLPASTHPGWIRD